MLIGPRLARARAPHVTNHSVGQYNVDGQLYAILLPVFGDLYFGPDCGRILAGLKIGPATGPRPTGGPILKFSRIGFGRSAARKPLKCGPEAFEVRPGSPCKLVFAGDCKPQRRRQPLCIHSGKQTRRAY